MAKRYFKKHPNLHHILIVGALLITSSVIWSVHQSNVLADTTTADFEPSTYTTGSVNGQDGWTSLGSAGSGCGLYDHAVAINTYGFAALGQQVLRISNAVTSGCFGDQTFSKSLLNEAGETIATSNGYSGGTRQRRFEAQFNFASTMTTHQPGLVMSVSPDRGDGSRMSYLRFEDNVGGIDVFFVDVQGTGNPASFISTQVASGLDRAKVHTAKFRIDYKEGPSNDKVRIEINGKKVHKGTTWENYYRFDSEASAEQTPRATDNLIFRTGGPAVIANAGNGFIFDNIKLSSTKPLKVKKVKDDEDEEDEEDIVNNAGHRVNKNKVQ